LVPPGLALGDPYRLIFVTSTTRDATSTDIADYNAFVTSAANAVTDLAALGTTWTAIASTSSIDARDNTATNPTVSSGVPIFNLAGTLMWFDYVGLWGNALQAPILYDENGTFVQRTVWTGTAADGTGDVFPGVEYVLGSVDGLASAGFNDPSLAFPAAFVLSTDGQYSLYGLSGILTVPEPGPGVFLVLALTAFASACRLAGRRP
jgi:hypothetical protein